MNEPLTESHLERMEGIVSGFRSKHWLWQDILAIVRELRRVRGVEENLRETIREMLDFASGWCNPTLSDDERFDHIERIGNLALATQEVSHE